MREKFFLPTTFVICAVIFFGWYQFFYTATQREILSVQLETRRLHEVERELGELKARRGNLTAFAAAKELELDAIKKFLPTTLETDSFIDELYRAAEFSRVSLISVTAGETVEAEEIQSQIVTLKLESDYISLMNFIREILDGARLVSLESFSVTGAKILSCELSFKIFAANP